MAKTYECYSEEWVDWLQGRLIADNNGNDWDKDPLVFTQNCPVCADPVDCVTAERLRGYGVAIPATVRHVCVFCGYIYQRDPVAGHLMNIGRLPVRRAL